MKLVAQGPKSLNKESKKKKKSNTDAAAYIALSNASSALMNKKAGNSQNRDSTKYVLDSAQKLGYFPKATFSLMIR